MPNILNTDSIEAIKQQLLKAHLLDTNDINIGPTSPQWWEAQNIPWWVVGELRRRSNSSNIGLNANKDVAINFEKYYTTYKGTMYPWVRVFSNGNGVRINNFVPRITVYNNNSSDVELDGFLLEGGTGFEKSYSALLESSSSESNQIIGFDANNNPHKINTNKNPRFNRYSPKYLPIPGITNVTISTKANLISEVTIAWKCYGLDQLTYMTPFFLTPNINIFVEFGWNLFNIKSLLNYSINDGENSDCVRLVEYPWEAYQRSLLSMGNYGIITGIITNYSIEQSSNSEFNCVTTIISRQAIYEGYKANVESSYNIASIRAFYTKHLTKLNDICHANLRTAIKYGNINARLNNIAEQLRIANNKLNIAVESYNKLQKTVQYPNEYLNLGQVYNPSTTYNSNDTSYAENIRNEYNQSRAVINTLTSQIKELQKEYSSIGGNFIQYIQVQNSTGQEIIKKQNTTFYNGMPEDRYFNGFSHLYNSGNINSVNLANPNKTSNINNGSENSLVIIPANDKNNGCFKSDIVKNKGWIQLDFVFELLNYLISIKSTEFKPSINISNTIITAHPNMISCDPNVLIPNPWAPKINRGNDIRSNSTQYSGEDDVLKNITNDSNNQTPSFNPKYGSFIITYSNSVNNLLKQSATVNDSIALDEYKQQMINICADTFKLGNPHDREDLDSIINYNYYTIGNHQHRSAAFPFVQDYILNNKNENITDGNKTIYTAYRYGFLKHLYISVSKIIEIFEESTSNTTSSDNDGLNIKTFVTKILNVINNAVCGFWKLDIIITESGELMVVDKAVNFNSGTQIYEIELGTTDSMVRNFSFAITLSNEQSAQILYSRGKNGTINNYLNGDECDIKNRSLPSIAYGDRIEKILSTKYNNKNNNIDYTESETNVHTDVSDNDAIMTEIQSGTNIEDTIICKLYVANSNKTYEEIRKDAINNPEMHNYAMLNVPPAIIPKLKRILYTPDIQTNNIKNISINDGYTGPADNFVIKMTFDGIVGFKLFQYIAIANLPEPYIPSNVIFMITEVYHSIEHSEWTTTITAMLRSANGLNYTPIRI